MLPRVLRVTRAKAPHKTALAVERTKFRKAAAAGREGADAPKPGDVALYAPKLSHEQKSAAGRTMRLFGQAAAVKQVFNGAARRGKTAAAADAKSGAGKRTTGGGGGGADGAIRPPEDFIAEGRRASAKDGIPTGLAGKKQRAKGAGRKAANQSRGQKRASEWRNKKK
jgi:nucleolar protein 12